MRLSDISSRNMKLLPKTNFQTSPNRWAKVKGPISAVIAIILDVGWYPEQPDKFTDGDGRAHLYEFSVVDIMRKFKRALGMPTVSSKVARLPKT